MLCDFFYTKLYYAVQASAAFGFVACACWFSACAAWCSSCIPGQSLQPRACMFSPPLVLAWVLFLRCLLSPSGFLFSLAYKVKVTRSRRSGCFQFSWRGRQTVHLLAHCLPCFVLCDLFWFVLNFTMLFRSLTQLASSLVLGWFSACVA